MGPSEHSEDASNMDPPAPARGFDVARTLPVGPGPGVDVDVARTLPAGPARPGVDVARTLPAGSPPPATPTAPPERIGRFRILDRLGSGGMGVVYSAYDETLDRKVAIKVLHAGDWGAQPRLVREAQAMARISHPNVVTVLEAGVVNGQVYVAMEFVRGATLGAWLAAAPRSWSQIVEVFTQAGRGLAAAHAAGLVHRDFKPSNVMIDDSGRVRVLDFGLVRAAGERPPTDLPASVSHTDFDLRLTHEDDLLGTPAYMAPEQWRGLDPQPASDQFSFCVALYEALFGQLPFPQDDVAQLARAVLHGQPREPPRRLGTPVRLAAVVLRGLRLDPKDRYPSMAALLAALDRPRLRGWRRAAAAGLLATVAGLAGFAVARTDSSEPPCTGGSRELARVWGTAQRDAVAAALHAAVPDYAGALGPRVSDEFERYAASWEEAHRDACLKHSQGMRSDVLLDRQMRCLERRLGGLDEAVRALADADADTAARALDVAGELPTLAPCLDVDALASESPPPDDADVALRVAALRARMNHAEVLARSGRLREALDLATEIAAEADRTDYLPIRAEALLLRGRLGTHQLDEGGEQVDLLTRAMSVGIEARADSVVAEALALRIYAMARQPDLAGRALADEPLALALAGRGSDPQALRGLVLNNIGTVYLARQEAEQARRYFRDALVLRESALGREDREVGYTLMNLAVATDPGPERVALLTRALETLELELGPAHPEMLDVRLSAAHLVDPDVGRTLLRPGCSALDRFVADDVAHRARCLLHLGRLAVELGDDTDADASFITAFDLAERAGERSSLAPSELGALAGYHALATRTPARAIPQLRATLADVRGGWWSRSDAAELGMLLGRALLLAGELDEARVSLEGSIADYTALVAHEPQFKPSQARTRVSLAEVLLRLDEAAIAEARSLLTAATEFYRGAGPAFARQLGKAERLAKRAVID